MNVALLYLAEGPALVAVGAGGKVILTDDLHASVLVLDRDDLFFGQSMTLLFAKGVSGRLDRRVCTRINVDAATFARWHVAI